MLKYQQLLAFKTFKDMISATSESLKARKNFIFQYFSLYEQLKFHAQLSWAWKSFITSGPVRVWCLSYLYFSIENQHVRFASTYVSQVGFCLTYSFSAEHAKQK